MSKSIWVIEAGEYSDYHVVGVFSSKDNAKRMAELMTGEFGGDCPRISEWPLDPGVAETSAGLQQWDVTMLRDGTVERCDAEQLSTYSLEQKDPWIWRRTKAPAYQGKENVQDALRATVWAKNPRHAAKIVNEKRAQMIASGDWA